MIGLQTIIFATVLTTRVLMTSVLFAESASPSEYGDASVEVHPKDNRQALVNPGMGWTFHFYSNTLTHYGSKLAPSDTLDDFPGLSCIYMRLPWAFVEPEEGKYDWSIVDAPAQRWIDKGLQVAFCFSACESWMTYATPKWVKDAGAKGHNFNTGQGVHPDGPFWEPDYGDPIFLNKLQQFLNAAAERYDGNPNVAFIDVGSLGVWGEGHTYSSTKLTILPETIRQHLDLYADEFKHTLLAVNVAFCLLGANAESQDKTVIDYAQQLGMTFRDNSLFVWPLPRSYTSDEMARAFWPSRPVILETDHYGGTVSKERWNSDILRQAVEDYHASYLSIHWYPREFLEKEQATIDVINCRLGYRLQVSKAAWPANVRRDEVLNLCSVWSNAGVAPCYPGGFITFTLKEADGGIVAVYVNEAFNVRNLGVASADKTIVTSVESKHRFALNMPTGTFDVYVSVGSRDGTPRIALPLDNMDGHRRYRLGQITVCE